MSQREGSIYVCVKTPEDWKKLYNIQLDEDLWLDAKTGQELFTDVPGTEWYIEGNWFPEFGAWSWYSGLGKFIDNIVHCLGYNNCLVLACLTDINVDPFTEVYYNFGRLEHHTVRGKCNWPNIYDTEAWLKWSKIKLSQERLIHLYQFKEHFSFVKRNMPVRFLTEEGKENRQGRLFISVKDPSAWKKAATLDLSDPIFNLPPDLCERISKTSSFDFVLDQPWHPVFGEHSFRVAIKDLVSKLKLRLGSKNCVIIAECADPDVAPVYEAAYTIDGSLAYKLINAPLHEVAISDIEAWLKLAEIKLDNKKTAFMKDFPSTAFDFLR